MCTVAAQVMLTVASIAMQAKSARDQAKFEQGTAEYNARVNENTAQQVIDKGVTEENALRLKTARLQSQQKAQLGALNVDVGSGSAFQLQEDTAILGEADAMRIRSGALGQASALMNESELIRSQGEYAQIAGKNKVTGSLLSGGAKIASTGVSDKWFTDKSVGKIAPGQSFEFTPR